jgi:predicted GNAT family acetyltransferase
VPEPHAPEPDRAVDGVTVVHRPDLMRYELHVDGQLRGVADYRERDGRVVFTHTEVDVPLRGKGYGDALVGFALDELRASSRHVGATCWFVREYVEQHPEYVELFT